MTSQAFDLSAFLSNPQLLAVSTVLAVALMQLFVCVSIRRSFRAEREERQRYYKELFGLLKKLEGLTAYRREVMLKHYDSILGGLEKELPQILGAELGESIVQTESALLSRLADLDPRLKHDPDARRKLDQLIVSMEGLEREVVKITTETVSRALSENRQHFMLEQGGAAVPLFS